MGEMTTLTIRIDEDLKAAIERAATAETRNVTDFMIRAALARLAPQCLTCGRSDQPGFAPPGLSAAMDDYLQRHKEQQSAAPTTITTLGPGSRPTVYWARIRNDTPHEGMLMVWVLFGAWRGELFAAHGNPIPIAIPRGFVTGWREDASAQWYHNFVAQGYASGNDQLQQVMRMQQAQQAEQPPPKRRR
jgi:hypothetical protein